MIKKDRVVNWLSVFFYNNYKLRIRCNKGGNYNEKSNFSICISQKNEINIIA